MTQKPELAKGTQYTRKKIQSYSYGLIDQIGKGYSSRVYRGRHDDTRNIEIYIDQKVAVKVIDLKLLKNDINRQLLDSEIQILKELRHTPNILHLCDIFTTKNNTYIVSELCVSDLNKVIKKSLSKIEAITFMSSIISGYMQVYKNNIVHRDLKPANILLTEQNQIKIADFGFAIKVDSIPKNNKYNVGSPLYMAPQSLKKNQYSFKTDIWALGVIFYQLLYNETPWKAKNQKQLLKKIQKESIQSIIEGKQLSTNMRLFITKCLKVDKNQRMSPQQLQFFQLNQTSNILSQKIMNSIQQSTSFQNNNSSTYPTKRTQKQYQKNVYSKKLITQTNQKIGLQNFKIGQNQIRLKTEGVNEHSNKKNISKILIAQVHFCRFLFKLLQKINQSVSYGLLKGHCSLEIEQLNKSFTSIIRYKIQNLNNFKTYNFIKCEGYKAYKLTNDYEKLIKIAKQYNSRYKSDLQRHWNETSNLSIDPTCKMIAALYKILEQVVKKMQKPQMQVFDISKDVIILDYLVTTKQLIEIIRMDPEDYQKFALKSRIEEIVDGKVTKIDLQLYNKIMQRVKQSMQKKGFLSFGGQFTLEGKYSLT